MVHSKKIQKNVLSVAKVPVETGTIFFFANDPAIKSTGMMTPYLPMSIAKDNA